jgi:putative ABC transport system permease protein
MGLLTMLIRKMFKNRWLIASLLAGMILSSALASSLPIYKDAIVLRMMHKEFEQYYMDSGSYPGSIHAFMQLIDIPEEDRFEKIKLEEERFAKRFVEAYSDILIGNNAIKETVAVRWAPADPARLNPKTDRYAPLIMRKDLEAHIELVDGRLPAKEPANGVIRHEGGEVRGQSGSRPGCRGCSREIAGRSVLERDAVKPSCKPVYCRRVHI